MKNQQVNCIKAPGCAGFLSPHLCERLLSNGCAALCVDNYYMGNRANIGHLFSSPCFEPMRHDSTFPLDVGSGHIYECTMLELAEQIIGTTNSRSRIVFKPLPADDPQRRKPDIARAQSQLGWQPSVPLQVGLARTVAYFDALLSEERQDARGVAP